MTLTFARVTLSSLLSLAVLSLPASAAPPAKPKTNPPPSADLAYTIKALQSGLTINGNALVQWTTAAGKYSVVTETRAMLVGKILDEKSEGAIDQYGLAPGTFTEKRFRKEATTATFDRAAKTISFTSSANTYPIKGGEQDRASAIWQLISIARGTPAKFRPGSSWTFVVAGQQDAEPWTFKVGKQEKIRTPLGEINALHVVKAPPPNSKGQKLDIWLAPSHEWYPVRLRFADDKGEYIEQTLETVNKR